jgi:hypothetical protein
MNAGLRHRNVKHTFAVTIFHEPAQTRIRAMSLLHLIIFTFAPVCKLLEIVVVLDRI